MFMPSHDIYLVKQDGTKESCAIIDCSTKLEVREFVKELQDAYQRDLTEFEKVQYTDKNGKVLYECTIKECLEDL